MGLAPGSGPNFRSGPRARSRTSQPLAGKARALPASVDFRTSCWCFLSCAVCLRTERLGVGRFNIIAEAAPDPEPFGTELHWALRSVLGVDPGLPGQLADDAPRLRHRPLARVEDDDPLAGRNDESVLIPGIEDDDPRKAGRRHPGLGAKHHLDRLVGT